MMLVTALMLGTGSSPQCLAPFLRASATGAKERGSGIGPLSVPHKADEPARATPSWVVLEDRRFRVGAPDVLERVDHLALGRVHAGALDERGHQVRLAGREGAQLGELALDLGAVSARPH